MKLGKICPKQYKPPPKFQDLEVSRDALKIQKRLGAGCFGEVFLALYFNKLEVAVKQLKPGSMPVEEFLEEAITMHKLSHKHIVQILGVVTRSEPILVITEFMRQGSLLDILHTKRDLTPSHLLNFLIDVCRMAISGGFF